MVSLSNHEGSFPFAVIPTGVRLAVRVSPRAARDAVEGVAADADGKPLLKIRLTAPPVDGEANAALIAFLAKALGMKKAQIVLHSGQTGRTKILHLSGDGAALLHKLTLLCGG